MNLSKLYANQVIKNYKELCLLLGIECKSSDSKKSVLKELERYCKYKKEGHIESPISGKPIRGIEQKTQLLPYILQVYETENNIMILVV